MVGASAGFHPNLATWLNLFQQLINPFITAQFTAPNRLLIAINAMNLKDAMWLIPP